MIRLSKRFLPLFVVVICLATVPSNSLAGLTFSCGEDSDIYQLVKATGHDTSRFDTAAEAIAKAREGSGVLVLSSGYPATLTPITEADYQLAAEKKLRLYVEFPEIVPGVDMGSPQLTAIGPYGSVLERIVVTDDFFGDALKPARIMAFYDCHFRPVTSDRDTIDTHLVAARVVGHDVAVLGLPEVTWPILFSVPRTDVLVSTTTFSPCVRARFMPIAAWKTVINRILKWLDPSVSEVAWSPTVHPTYSKEDAIPRDAREKAIGRATQWFVDSKLLLDPEGKEFVYDTPNPHGTLPFPENWKGTGDGSLGLIECYIGKRIYLDGRQPCNPCIRADCNGEASMALCLGGQFVNDPEKSAIARRILDFVYFESGMAGGPRCEPGNSAFGMLSHNTKSPGQYYSDDHARALLGTMTAAAVLESNRWDEAMCRTILANFRVTNSDGYNGGGFIDDGALQSGGWEPFWFRGGHAYSPHYQAYIWATFLWLYDKTGYEPLLDRARNGIATMMKAYPDHWIAECGRMDEELCHMLLPLAYLIRVDDKPEYRAWLGRLVDDIVANTDACGAIAQRVTAPYASNMQYGTGEAPIVYQTGDPGVDLLYTMNFGFSGLHEASFILDDPKLDDALDRIEEFLIRIQTSSQTHPELSGTWYRAFDFNHWEYWGSDGEIGWCMLSTETGWTHSWITSTLVLRQRKESLWDLTKKSDLNRVFEPLRKHMVPEELFQAKTLEEYKSLRAALK